MAKVLTVILLAFVPTVAKGALADGLPILQHTPALVTVVFTNIVLTVLAMIASRTATMFISFLARSILTQSPTPAWITLTVWHATPDGALAIDAGVTHRELAGRPMVPWHTGAAGLRLWGTCHDAIPSIETLNVCTQVVALCLIDASITPPATPSQLALTEGLAPALD